MNILKLNRNIIILIFITVFLSLSPMPEKYIRIIDYNNQKYISMHEFTNILDINNSFDIVTGRGKLFYKGSIAVYQIGFSVMLLNGILIKTNYPVIRLHGEILFPLRFFKNIMKDFYPFYSLSEEENLIYVQRRKILQKPEKEYKGEKISFIIIDPGHGGKDPGAIGKGGLYEKSITLKVSKLVEKYLKTKLRNIKIKLTRRSDEFIELVERTEIANRMLKKDENGIFASIHVNASILQSVSGFETYFLSQNPSNEEARTTAAWENNVIIYEENTNSKTYSDVQHVEAIMLNTQIQKESSMLATLIQKNLDKNINEFKSKGVKTADFIVLRGALMPSVLLEVGFITNLKEAKYLQRYSYQKKIAKGIGDGIIEFIKEYNKNIKN